MEPDRSHSCPPESESQRQSAQASSNGHDPSAGEALKQAGAHLRELKEYASLYVTAKLDSFKLTMRNIVLYAALGIVGAIVAVGLLITAAALLLTGLAGGIGALFEPDRYWVGALIVGFAVLALAMGGIFFVMRMLSGSSKKRTIEKYEQRKRQERIEHGHDVEERAREQAVEQRQTR